MLPDNTPLPSINDPAELRQRTEFCRDKLSMVEYAEWFCDGRKLHVVDFANRMLKYDLIEDLQYYETFPACIEDWAEGIAGRIVEKMLTSDESGEYRDVKSALTDALIASPRALRALIGTGMIARDHFGLLDDGEWSGTLQNEPDSVGTIREEKGAGPTGKSGWYEVSVYERVLCTYRVEAESKAEAVALVHAHASNQHSPAAVQKRLSEVKLEEIDTLPLGLDDDTCDDLNEAVIDALSQIAPHVPLQYLGNLNRHRFGVSGFRAVEELNA